MWNHWPSKAAMIRHTVCHKNLPQVHIIEDDMEEESEGIVEEAITIECPEKLFVRTDRDGGLSSLINIIVMEKNLSLQLGDIMNEPSVTGVICTDLKGLPLATKGFAKPSSSGSISCIASHAAKLFPDLHQTPVICIESDSSSLLIRSHDKIVLGIYKTKV